MKKATGALNPDQLCDCQKCHFYMPGTEYPRCGLAAYLRKGFQLRDADKIRNTIENCHCKSAVAAEIYAGLREGGEEGGTV